MDTSNARALLGVGEDAGTEQTGRTHSDGVASTDLPAPAATPTDLPRELTAWLDWLAPLARIDLLERVPIEPLERCAWVAATGLTAWLATPATRRPLAPLVLVALALWARDREAEADALVRRLRREPPRELGDMGAWWSAARDLQTIGARAEPMVRAMAESLLRGDNTPFIAWLDGEPIIEHSRWRVWLDTGDKRLALRFGPAFDAHGARPGRRALGFWGWVVLLVVVPAIGGLIHRVVWGGASDRDDALGPVISTRIEHQLMCDASKALCTQYDALARAIADGDCAAGVGAWRAIADHTATSRTLRDPEVRYHLAPALRSVLARLVGRCSDEPSARVGAP